MVVRIKRRELCSSALRDTALGIAGSYGGALLNASLLERERVNKDDSSKVASTASFDKGQ